MKTEENKANEQEKIGNKYQSMGISIGMCFGVTGGKRIQNCSNK